MKIAFPIGRSIAGVIAGVLVIAGVFFLVEAYRIRKEFYRQSEARPLDMPVDLSKPGQFTAPFKQTWRACHGQTISLHVPVNALAGLSPSDLLTSLDFTWQIANEDGEIIAYDESTGEGNWDNRSYDGVIPLAYFRPFGLGDYIFMCTVMTGSPVLAGLEQRLVCQYQPCGLELLPAVLLKAIGIIALVISGIILLVIRAITKRKRRCQTTTKSTLSSEAAPSASTDER